MHSKLAFFHVHLSSLCNETDFCVDSQVFSTGKSYLNDSVKVSTRKFLVLTHWQPISFSMSKASNVGLGF